MSSLGEKCGLPGPTNTLLGRSAATEVIELYKGRTGTTSKENGGCQFYVTQRDPWKGDLPPPIS